MNWTNRVDRALRERARQVIPGGMYGHESTRILPPEFPQFFSPGKGARLWDSDSNPYVDYLCAYGPNLFGYVGLAQQASTHGFGLRQTGPVVMPQILFEDDKDFRIGYGWTVECLKRGVYFHPYHNGFISAAHGEAELREPLDATERAFGALKVAKPSLEPNAALMSLFAHA